MTSKYFLIGISVVVILTGIIVSACSSDVEKSIQTEESAKETSKAQTLSEGVDSTVAPVAGGMESYLQALGAFKPKQS